MTMSSNKNTPTGEEKIDCFDPDRQGSSALGWLAKMESFAREHHLSDDQKYCFAQGKLEGAAKEWLASSKVTGWKEFRKAFVEAFGKEEINSRPVSRTLRTLERRKILPNEPVEEYIEEMVKLGQRAKLSEGIIVGHIVAGLGDPVLSKAIPRGTRIQQLRKAIQWKKEVEILMQQYNSSECSTSVECFDKLVNEMESIVLDGESFTDAIQGDEDVLKTHADELNSTLRQNRDALSSSLFDLGTSKTHEIVVNLNPGSLINPVKTRARADLHNGALQTSLISLLTCDVVQKSSSSSSTFVHPSHLVDSELLLDLSHLNAICCRESPNLLLPQAILPALATFRFFTLLDFNGGHLQIPLEPIGCSRSYFAFSTPFGTFEFRRAPKNFTNTAPVFNKILIELARKLHPADTVIVLNDVLVVPSCDVPEGLQKLSRVLRALVAFGLTADLRRSRFFERGIKLFNWIVQHGKVTSDGFPTFEPGQRDQRLRLVIKLSENEEANACWQAVLQRRRHGFAFETLGSFLGRKVRNRAKLDEDEVHDRNSSLVEHLENSIENFRQFLLFAAFEVVVLDTESTLRGDEIKRRLLQVQQFNFEVIFSDESEEDISCQ